VSSGTREPGNRSRLWRELTLGIGVFGLYAIIASLDGRTGRQAVAARHGRALLRAERWLHLDPEHALNRWLAPHETLRTIANYEYAITYVVSAFALLAWLYVARPAVYRWARTSFVLLNLGGLACFTLFPAAPPRFLNEGFVDTVRQGHTWGSWGSPLVGHANQVGAMPSLHFAWALWVSVVLAAISGRRIVQLVSAVHVLVTLYVILATANHYLLDAVAGALLVAACVALTGPPPGRRVPAADAFFLHVESAAAPQHVGGVVTVRTDRSGAEWHADVRSLVRSRLAGVPRFRQRLSPRSRWRRPRWVDAPELDWDWHVPARDLTGPDGRPGGDAAFHALVAEIAATRLPPDRPLWRMYAVTGLEPGRAGAVLVVHHVIADGIGAVAQALRLLEPPLPPLEAAGGRRPGLVRTVVATVAGLGQLAVDGRAPAALPSSGTADRRFGTVAVPLDEVRAAARRHGTRVSDVLLSAVAGALRRVAPAAAGGPAAELRVTVPLMVREPGAAVEGNVTAAVMIDLPLGPVGEVERLTDIARRSRRLYTGTRALASRFVMGPVGEAMPPPLHRWFARTVYGGRYFQAIVSNMPGPPVQLSLAGAPLGPVYPLLPLAPAAPLAVGALGWNGDLCVGIVTDPALVGDAGEFAAALRAVVAELGASPGVQPQLSDRSPGYDPAAPDDRTAGNGARRRRARAAGPGSESTPERA
jgi:hypothetical protein